MSSTTMNKKSTCNDNNNKVRSSTKRPRAPIACFRCHHKKVRCDGVHPNCTRCTSTGVLCAYPSSRRSRTTQPTNIDPFIDNLSHLEARIRRIESDLENQRTMVNSIVSPTVSTFNEAAGGATIDANAIAEQLGSKMLKTEMEVQDSRSILAQLRLRGEQRISKGKRAAAAVAVQQQQQQQQTRGKPTVSCSMPLPNKIKEEQEKTNHGHSRQQMHHQSNIKSFTNHKKATSSNNYQLQQQKQQQLHRSSSISSDKTITPASISLVSSSDNMYNPSTGNNSLYFQGMMLGNSTDLSSLYDTTSTSGGPPGHGMDWTLFDPNQQQSDNTSLFPPYNTNNSNGGGHLLFNNKMMMDTSPVSTRSSSLASSATTNHFMVSGGYPTADAPSLLQPSNSTTSTTSNATSCSSLTSCGGNDIFTGLGMIDDMMLQQQQQQQSMMESQDVHILSNNLSIWYYPL